MFTKHSGIPNQARESIRDTAFLVYIFLCACMDVMNMVKSCSQCSRDTSCANDISLSINTFGFILLLCQRVAIPLIHSSPFFSVENPIAFVKPKQREKRKDFRYLSSSLISSLHIVKSFFLSLSPQLSFHLSQDPLEGRKSMHRSARGKERSDWKGKKWRNRNKRRQRKQAASKETSDRERN